MQAAYGICAGWQGVEDISSKGNKAYCEAVKLAAQKATFPAFTNPEVYRDFQKVGFDMRGQLGGYCSNV